MFVFVVLRGTQFMCTLAVNLLPNHNLSIYIRCPFTSSLSISRAK